MLEFSFFQIWSYQVLSALCTKIIHFGAYGKRIGGSMELSEKENEKLHQKLKIIHWLESLRWADEDKIKKDFETSFYHNKSFFLNEDGSVKNAEAILLTHYLVYICDRQMDYRYVFKAGGYTVSWLVEDFLNNLKSIIEDKKSIRDKIVSLFKIHTNIEKREKKKKKENETQEKYSYFLRADLDENADENENIKTFFKNYNENKRVDYKDEVRFSSRFMVIDILCMYKTLLKLCEKYDGSFEEFLNKAVSGDKSLYSLAKEFYKLTYSYATNKIKIKNDDIDNLFDEFNKLDSKDEFDQYKSKRIWCLARDFIYHPVFKECFKTLVGDKIFENCKNNIKSLELPGDVWNNNLTFAKCFWLGNKGADIKKDDKEKVKYISNSSKYVRERYNKMYPSENDSNSPDHWIPKDFDITFNFVPQMCSQDKCSNCPLNNEEKDSNDILGEFCHEQKDKLCSFVLYAIGIEHKCPGKEKCEMINIIHRSK